VTATEVEPATETVVAPVSGDDADVVRNGDAPSSGRSRRRSRRGEDAGGAADAPSEKRERSARRTPGRTTRVILRRLDPWSVLKLSLVYYLAVFLVILVAGVILWGGAEALGVIGNIESFMVDIGFEDFRFIPGQLLGGVALGGLVLVVAGTVANVILCALFNLMGDVTGGLRMTLEEDLPRRRTGSERDATV